MEEGMRKKSFLPIVLWVGLGFVLGGVLGWAIGSAATCYEEASSCAVDVEAVGVVGAWVGSLGTVLAIGAAVASYRSMELSRRSAATERSVQRQSGFDRLTRQAELVTFDIKGADWNEDSLNQLTVEFRNMSDSRVFNTTLEFEGGREVVAEVLEPGEQASKTVGVLIRRSGTLQDYLASLVGRSTLRFVLGGVAWERRGSVLKSGAKDDGDSTLQ
ncbi:hypothetical protein [Ornithinimicrobium cerasi]|uniref:hypothetical protein n=1 Tax=Ornithinimicrobium cerasi TaxID=2248773 RepID=UPI001142B55F|nr:hypothetical protein [Ornithinimicrobium cerasi]